jgi:hypothetical protein
LALFSWRCLLNTEIAQVFFYGCGQGEFVVVSAFKEKFLAKRMSWVACIYALRYFCVIFLD